MIIEFSVQNFRSIYDKVTLSMLASKLTGKEATLDNIFYHENYPNLPLLKTAVIYGANASGKSNVIESVHFFRELILTSTRNWLIKEIPYVPFSLDSKALNDPSCFEMDFIASDNIRYVYSFKINHEEILEESLSEYTSRKETRLFFRKKGESILFGNAFKGEKKTLEESLAKGVLLLSKAANGNFKQAINVYEYFLSFFNLVVKGRSERSFSLQKPFDINNHKKQITDFLKTADTGIDGFVIKKVGDKYSHLKDVVGTKMGTSFNSDENESQIEVIHNFTDKSGLSQRRWRLEEESEGTQKLFELAGHIITILNKGEILFFDEINNSLHPHLSKFIIELFNNKETNPKNAQLIFTTHDVSLLSKELFRRDQIWFTEKNNKGMTELYSLGSFDKKEVRWDIPFDKWYLSGRFGALPAIQDFKIKPE